MLTFNQETETQAIEHGDLDFITARMRPFNVQACQIQEPFKIKVKSPDLVLLGKSGDYLVVSVKGIIYPCDKTVFEESYDIL